MADMIELVKRYLQLLTLCQSGIIGLKSHPELLRTAVTLVPNHAFEKSLVEQSERDAALAQREVDEQFPLLSGIIIVGVWSALETAIKDFLVAWIKNAPDAYDTPMIQSLDGKLAAFAMMEDDDKCRYIVERLEAKLSASLKSGKNRFESLLDSFGFSGAVDPRLSHKLYEFQKVRNVVAHNGGTADRKFIEACPWFALSPGMKVPLTPELASDYPLVAAFYGLSLVHRIKERFGENVEEGRQVLLSDIEELGWVEVPESRRA